MAYRPSVRNVIEDADIKKTVCACSCEEHTYCGVILQPDAIIKAKAVKVPVQKGAKAAIPSLWITKGVEQCCVRFAQRSYNNNATSKQWCFL